MDKEEFEKAVHDNAYKLLKVILDTQPNLMNGSSLSASNGEAAGKFVNALYESLISLETLHLKKTLIND